MSKLEHTDFSQNSANRCIKSRYSGRCCRNICVVVFSEVAPIRDIQLFVGMKILSFSPLTQVFLLVAVQSEVNIQAVYQAYSCNPGDLESTDV